MIKYIVILSGLGLMATSALARREGVTEIDVNGDGVMTIDELQAAYPEMDAETFSAIDANKDGAIDDAEMIAGQERGLVPPLTDG